MSRSHLRPPSPLLFGVLGLALAQCSDTTPPEDRSELVFLTRNAPTTYYEDRHGRWAGFEHDLATAFAGSLNMRARFVVLASIDEILAGVARGDGDLAAAGLTRTASRERKFITGPPYQTVEELVVCHPSLAVRAPSDLLGVRLQVAAASSHQERLEELQQELPRLRWTATSDSPEQLLQRVGSGDLDCTVADSNALAIGRRHLPAVSTPFSLGHEEPLVWFISRRSGFLKPRLEKWLADFRGRGGLQALNDKHYGHVGDFDFHDTAVFLARISERLPQYRPLFASAASESGLPWALLAALAYQESHWDPQATSHTGVRGMMMLTRNTARGVGVTDRLDPAQSISGGARYLAHLVERIPAYIAEPDRLWLALAAYNVGIAHLQDARVLAVELNRNPNTWPGVKPCLPRLSQKRHYLELRHGYARGHEAVVFVEHIRSYYDLLLQATEQTV